MTKTGDYTYGAFLAQEGNPRTRSIREHYVGQWVAWLKSESIDPLDVQSSDVMRFIDIKRERLAPSTCVTIQRSIRAYHRWLEQSGFIERNPVAQVKDEQLRRNPPKFVPPDDLRRMLEASTGPRNWAIIAILAFNSLRVSELTACNVSDLRTHQNQEVLHFRPAGEGLRRLNHAVLHESISDALGEYLNGRRTGPLFTSRNGKRLNRNAVGSYIVKLTAERAELGYRVTPDMLTNSLHTAALQRGFSYRGLVRSIGIPNRHYGDRYFDLIEGTVEDNASLRFARLVLNPPETATATLLHVDALLRETDLPEPFAVMAAGAVVENHLRALAEHNGVAISTDSTKPGISFYANELQRRKVLKMPDARKFRSIGDHRNDAAHGWFDRIPQGTGARLVREARELLAAYPLHLVGPRIRDKKSGPPVKADRRKDQD